jgi:hypothetical protein
MLLEGRIDGEWF